MKPALAITLLTACWGGCTFDPVGLRQLGDQGLVGDHSREALPVQPRDAGSERREASVADLAVDQQQPDTRPSCRPAQLLCDNRCVDPLTDPSNCGGCGQLCAGDQYCAEGLCCASGWLNCGGGSCVDPLTDPSNCNGCGAVCLFPNTCEGGSCVVHGCADGTDEQTFTQGMRGCAGRLTFPERATLCAPGFRVCAAQEWVARRDGQAPAYNYWTDDALRYNGWPDSCWVSTTVGYECSPSSSPMRVCSGSSDPLGNECNWSDCGYGSYPPSEFFGGCNNNPTAGTLCCPE